MKLIAACALVFGTFASIRENWRGSNDAARRSQCINNLKVLGLAIHEYSEKYESLPIGTIPNPGLPVKRRLGWNYLIAPELEIRPPLTPINLSQAWDDPYFKPPKYPSCPENCPSNRDQASANYVGIAGLGIDAPGLPKTDRRAGAFGDNRVVTFADFADGTSQTMMVAESGRKAGPWYAGGRSTVRGLDPSHPPYVGPGGQFGGVHPIATTVLMADGSVQCLKDSIDPKVYEALSTMAGGEMVSAP